MVQALQQLLVVQQVALHNAHNPYLSWLGSPLQPTAEGTDRVSPDAVNQAVQGAQPSFRLTDFI